MFIRLQQDLCGVFKFGEVVDMLIDGICLVCGRECKHHHYYCNEHYPKERAAFRNMREQKAELSNLRRENASLKKRLSQVKTSYKAEIKRLQDELNHSHSQG